MLDKSIYVLLIFYPVALVIGPFLSDGIVVISAIYFFMIADREKIWVWLKSYLIILIIFFWIYIVLRSLLSQEPFFSLESSLFYIRYLFFSLTVCYIYQKFEGLKKYLGISLIVSMLIVAFDGYLQYFLNFNLLGHELTNPARIHGLFRDEAVIGSYLSRLFPLAVFFIFINIKNITTLRASIYLFTTFIVILIYLSGERSAFFFSILTIVSFLLLSDRFKKHYLFLIGILLCITVILTTSIDTLKSRMVDQTLNEFGINNNSNNIFIFTPIHQDHFYSAILMFNDNILFGQGPKMFRKLCKLNEFYPDGCSTHPHNSYMQLLAEVGLIGTIPVIFLFILISYFMLKQFFNIYILRTTDILKIENISLLSCFLISLWPIIPTGSFFNNWLNCIYYLPLGIYLAENTKFKIIN